MTQRGVGWDTSDDDNESTNSSCEARQSCQQNSSHGVLLVLVKQCVVVLNRVAVAGVTKLGGSLQAPTWSGTSLFVCVVVSMVMTMIMVVSMVVAMGVIVAKRAAAFPCGFMRVIMRVIMGSTFSMRMDSTFLIAVGVRMIMGVIVAERAPFLRGGMVMVMVMAVAC